jgi:hypothetical protein
MARRIGLALATLVAGSGLALATLVAGSGLALADKMLTGEDAAYIDWGVKNCGVKSTDKEHAMVDKANAKDAAGFLRTYQSKDLSDARSSPSKQEAVCSDVKTWYGPFGSRFADLIKWDNSPSTAASDKSAPATTAAGKGKRRPSQ